MSSLGHEANPQQSACCPFRHTAQAGEGFSLGANPLPLGSWGRPGFAQYQLNNLKGQHFMRYPAFVLSVLFSALSPIPAMAQNRLSTASDFSKPGEPVSQECMKEAS